MPIPPLPAELHKLIIDEIGRGIVEGFVEEDIRQGRASVQACTLVCRHWHVYTLAYIFGSMKLPMDSLRPLTHARQFARLTSFSALIDSNPLIGKSVRTLVLVAERGVPEMLHRALEEIAPKLQHIKKLTINSQEGFNLSRAFYKALSIFLRAPQLEHLTFHKVSIFRASIETWDVGLDHAGHPSSLSLLYKLVLIYSDNVLEMMQHNPWFRALFDNVQDVTMSFSFTKPPQWKNTLKWANIRNLSLSSHPMGPLAEKFRAFFEGIPWASFSRLSSLKVSMIFYGPAYWRPLPAGWFGTHPIPCFLSGASQLKQLRALAVDYTFRTPFIEESWLNQTLQELYGECLNPTFEQRGSFPILESFSTYLVTTVVEHQFPQHIDKAILLNRTMCQMPSIFGPGGRVEVDGWNAVVDGKLDMIRTRLTRDV